MIPGVWGFMLINEPSAVAVLFGMVFALPFGAFSAFSFAMLWTVVRPQSADERTAAIQRFVEGGKVSPPFRLGLRATGVISAVTLIAMSVGRRPPGDHAQHAQGHIAEDESSH